MKNRLIQAYKQAPWRIQLQWIGLFLLGLVLVSSITGVYLNISAQAATAGRKIQSLERNINIIQNDIAKLTNELATAKSTKNMMSRAEELGFVLLNPNEAVYLEIPGYAQDADLVLAPPRINVISESPIVHSTYRISLWDWFVDQIWHSSMDTSPSGEEIIP